MPYLSGICGRNIHLQAAFAIAVSSLTLYAAPGNQGGDFNACAADRPCITTQSQAGNTVIFRWNDGGNRTDFYNVRYAAAGGEKQVENRTGHFTFNDVRPNGIYRIKVQGCTKPLVGRSHCTDWAEATVRTR